MTRLFPILAVVLFFLFALGSYLFGGLVLYSPDHFVGSYAFNEYWWGVFRETGHFPWMNHYVGMGTSPLFNPLYQVLYPVNFFQWLVPPLAYFRWGFWIHLVLLGLALYRWERAMGRDPFLTPLVLASSVALAFVSSNFGFLYSVVWGVWILSELALPRPSSIRLCVFTLFLVTAGEPFSTFLVLLYALLENLKYRRWGQLVFLNATAILVGVLVYGPALMVSAYTTRAGGLSESDALAFSFHPYRLLTLLSPFFFGARALHTFHPSSVTNDSPFYPRFYFETAYLCAPLLILGLLGIARTVREKKWPLLFMLLFALSVALGRWGTMRLLHSFFPFSLLRHPEKALVLSLLYLIACAFLVPPREILRSKLTPVLLGVCLVLPWLTYDHEWKFAVAALVLLAIWFLHFKKWLPERPALYLFLAVGLLQSYWARPQPATISLVDVPVRDELAQTLLDKSQRGTMARMELGPGIAVSRSPHQSLLGEYGVERRAVISGYEAVENRYARALVDELLGPDSPEAMKARPRSPGELKALVHLGNLHLLALNPGIFLPSLNQALDVFQADPVSGRAVLSPKSEPSYGWWISRLNSTSDKSVTFDWPPRVPKHRLFLGGIEQTGSYQEKVECPEAQPLPLADIAVRKETENLLSLDFSVPCSGWIFLSQAMIPGWILTSNDKEIPLHPLNNGLIGFQVPAGKFEGELRFRPFRALWNFMTARKPEDGSPETRT